MILKLMREIFDKSSDMQSVFKPFKKADIIYNTLETARKRKLINMIQLLKKLKLGWRRTVKKSKSNILFLT
jgi:hypothetical protein